MFDPADTAPSHRVRARPSCGFGPPWVRRAGWSSWASPDPVDLLAAGATANLRASDDERAAVGDALTRHHLAGRIDVDEYTERLEAAYGATTRGDLAPLLADLPREVPSPPPHRRRPRGLWIGALVVLAVLITLTVWTGRPFIIGGWWLLVVAWVWSRSHRWSPVDRRPSV
jgi:hypothetical protein